MKRIVFGLWVSLVAAAALAQQGGERNRDEPEQSRGAERLTTLPAFPKPENLIEFYVSPLASNRFFIDTQSVSVGPDGVVRYTLMVNAAGGASNISFEGIRCGSGEYKIFATGRNDGTWAGARAGDWRPIENKTVNGHHAVLNRDFFCPNGLPPDDAAEGVEALRRGKHPRAQ